MVGFYTKYTYWGEDGHCCWAFCTKPRTKGMFCEEHGKIKIRVTVVDSIETTTSHKGFHKKY